MKKISMAIILSIVLSLMISSMAFAACSDTFNFGHPTSINPFYHFNASQQWADFNCDTSSHHSTSIQVCPECGTDTSKSPIQPKGVNAHSETGWHYNPSQWNSYYGHD